ncbi:hypothetical protein D3C86_1451420 [compost metagenome]
MRWAVVHSLAQDINDTALGNLTLNSVQELSALDTFYGQLQRFDGIRLGRTQEYE